MTGTIECNTRLLLYNQGKDLHNALKRSNNQNFISYADIDLINSIHEHKKHHMPNRLAKVLEQSVREFCRKGNCYGVLKD